MKLTVVLLMSIFISTVFAPLAASAAIEVFLPQPAGPAWWKRSGEKWLALFQVKPSATIPKPKFELRAVQSKIYIDSKDGVIKLGAQNSPDPILFIAGLTAKPGSIEASSNLPFGTPVELSDAKPIQFEFQSKNWTLSRKTLNVVRSNVDSTDVQVKYALASPTATYDLGQSECRISIRAAAKDCQEKITLQFIGDIDHDGIPDLFFQPQAEPQSMQLWLSTNKESAKIASDGTKPGAVYRAQVRKSGKDLGLAEKIPGLLIPNEIAPTQKNAFTLDQWFALKTPADAKSQLEPTSIWVTCPQALSSDGTCSETTLISPARNIDAKFLVRGISGLKAGEVNSAKITDLPVDASRDDAFPSFEIEFNGTKSKLSGGQGIYTLESPLRAVVFPVKLQDPDHRPKLVWAGDLNHDGKLDLYFDVKEDESINHFLFISPDAATGPIAGPTTQFCTGTCY